MSEVASTAPKSGRSWRDISQEVKPRAMSKKGRRRQYTSWIKAGTLTLLFCGLALGGYHLVHEWETDRAGFAESVKSEPVRDVLVITDGTITKKWVEQTLALPKGATLMALDLTALRNRLAAQGQIRTAVVTRKFPDMLVVTLQERFPVARVQAQDGLGRPKQLFVARDGVVYEGTNYEMKMVGGLPWLDGIRLVRQGSGFAPIAGMDDVSTLLTKAQIEAPHLYRTWLIVSLARLADRDEISVKAQDVAEIIFSRKVDFHTQIAQLDSVLDEVKKHTDVAPRINVSLGGQVLAKLERSPDELAKQEYSSPFTLQPIQRKEQRDF